MSCYRQSPNAGEIAGENAICTVCYEDLKPVVENLQAISACGHVFHELCLQQWFEYCRARNCPMCKQKCGSKDPCRLYFPSSGNRISSEKVVEIEEDPVVLRAKVKRLEGILEGQTKENVEVSVKWRQCKELLEEETVRRWEAMLDIALTQNLLNLKSEECAQLSAHSTKQHEKIMALAKELAALKLVSDLSLEEDDVLKLALLVNNANTKVSIDTLVKSFVIRNSKYKEILAKCNQLARGEAQSSEKVLEIIDRLMKELEMIYEERERDNKALRDIKVSIAKPATESLVSSDNTTKKDGFPNRGSCSFISKTDSVIEIDDDVSIMEDPNGKDNNGQKKSDNPWIKDIEFNLRIDPTRPVSPRSCGAGSGANQNLRRWSKQGEKNEATPSLGWT